MKLTGAFITGSLMQISVISVPFLSAIFSTSPLTPLQWLIVALLSISPLLLVEAEKRAMKTDISESGSVPSVNTFRYKKSGCCK